MAAIPSIQMPSAALSEEIMEILTLPSVMWPDGSPVTKKPCPLFPETDEVTPFKRQLAGKVNRFTLTALGWQESGVKMREEAAQSSTQLQQLLERVQPKRDFRQLTKSVSESTLSGFIPFSERVQTRSPISLSEEHAKTHAPACKRPDFSVAKDIFQKVLFITDLPEVVGGKLKDNFDKKTFTNGCAARISYVLGETGCKIPKIEGETVSGRNGEQYIYRLKTLEKFLTKAYGPPDYEWNGSTRKGSMEGKKGILIEFWSHSTPTASGHAELSENDALIFEKQNARTVFWELPDEIKADESSSPHDRPMFSDPLNDHDPFFQY